MANASPYLLGQARRVAAEERFLNWQVAFPGVWSAWEPCRATRRIRRRDRESALGPDEAAAGGVVRRAAPRDRHGYARGRPQAHDRPILRRRGDPLAREFADASARAQTAVHMARASGEYPLLSGGDVNLYSLFVERAMTLVKPDGMVGLLTPSGIASDKTASAFFKGVATEGRLRALYDFENRRTRYGAQPVLPGRGHAVIQVLRLCSRVRRRPNERACHDVPSSVQDVSPNSTIPNAVSR